MESTPNLGENKIQWEWILKTPSFVQPLPLLTPDSAPSPSHPFFTSSGLNPVTALLLPSKHPPNSLRPAPLLRLPFSSLIAAAAARSSPPPDSYNIYESDPDFKNAYGWSTAVDKHKYKPLKKHGISVILVNLTAGAMLAPHVNPTATEYGVVLAGSGTVQVVFPNGTAAMEAEVAEGDSFWIPRYFPFCQVAARDGPMVLFGFTTSARRNRPQLLAGSMSVLRSTMVLLRGSRRGSRGRRCNGGASRRTGVGRHGRRQRRCLLCRKWLGKGFMGLVRCWRH